MHPVCRAVGGFILWSFFLVFLSQEAEKNDMATNAGLVAVLCIFCIIFALVLVVFAAKFIQSPRSNFERLKDDVPMVSWRFKKPDVWTHCSLQTTFKSKIFPLCEVSKNKREIHRNLKITPAVPQHGHCKHIQIEKETAGGIYNMYKNI